ncbi:ABC transporter substrate-binding protein [Romboutsia ilealis]|uniref:ABC transporter substrate-binding protein n=1 Tax=Romboutsia ilealis TaxID=1115758 RepID=UPI0024953890|nr:ABC transporter substrate-binding protein [Romboutsia ilealis]
MKIKKMISTTLVISLVALSLTGCKIKEQNQVVNGVSEGKVQIEFWNALTGKNEEILKGFVDEFNDQSENVEVNMVSQGDYWENGTKLQAAIAAKNQPDLTMLEITQISQFASFGTLANVDDYISDETKEDFLDGLMREAEYNGETVAVPLNRSTPLLYINKDMCESAGLDPAGPKNWEELKVYAEKLTNKEEGIVGLAVPIDIWFYEALIYQQGGEIVDSNNQVAFNNEKGIKALELWQDMMKEGTMQLPAGEGYDAWDTAKDAFINGKAGMTLQSTASLAGILEQTQERFTVNTAFLPGDTQYGVPTGGANLVIMEGSSEEEKQAASEFIEFMSEKENVIKFSMDTGYMPTTKSALESEEMSKLYEEKPQYKVAVDQLEYASKRPSVVGYVEASEKLMNEMKKCLMDLNIDAKETLNKATSIMQEVIDKNNK